MSARSNSEIRTPRGPGLTRPGQAIAFVVLALIAWVIYASRLFTGGPYPFSTDAMGHLSRISSIAEQMKSGALLPRWNPDWYMGSQLFEYYPPASSFLLAPFAAIWSASTAYKMFAFAVPIAIFAATFLVVRSRIGLFGAIVAGVGASTSPWLLRTLFSEGHIPVSALAPLIPLLLLFSIKLWEFESRRRFVIVALSVALAVLTHNLVALMLLLSVDIALAIETFSWSRNRLRGLLHLVIAQVSGLLLVSWWLLPALLKLHFPDTPNRGAFERIFIYSRSWEIFDITARSDLLLAYSGVVLFGFAVVGIAVGYQRAWVRVVAMVAAVSYLYAFGMNSPVISRFGMLQELIFFERFLLIATISSAILTGVAVAPVAKAISRKSNAQFNLNVILVAILVIVVLLADSWPYRDHVRNTTHAEWERVASQLDAQSPEGRIVDLSGRPEPSFFIPNSGRSAVFGWSVESTPHAKYFPLVAAGIRSGNIDLVARQLGQWWASGANAFAGDELTATALTEVGFETDLEFDRGNPVDAWVRSQPISPIMLYERNAVISGKAWPTAAGLFPFATLPESKTFVATDHLADQLLLILAEPDSKIGEDEKTEILDWVSEGHDLLILMTNDPAIWTAGYGTDQVDLVGNAQLSDPQAGGQPGAQIKTGSTASPWRVRMPDDPSLTSVLDITDDSRRPVPILAKAEHGSGSIWLLGGSSHLLASNPGSGPFIDSIQGSLVQALPGLNTEVVLDSPSVEYFSQEGGELDAAFDVGDYQGKLMLSVTAAPHWQSVQLDGKSIAFESVENLVVIEVGPGQHLLSMKIGETAPSWMALTVSIIGLLFIVIWTYKLPWLLARIGTLKLG